MEFRRREFMAASGLSLSTLLLAACGGGSSGGGGNGGGGGGGSELSILTPEFAGTTGADALEKKILANFDEATFAVDYVNWDRLNEKLSAAVAGGVVSDLIMVGAGWVEPFGYKNVLAELPDSLAEGKAIDEALLGPCRYDGKLYALPYFVDGRILPYHKEMLADAGVSEGDLPTDLEGFRDLLKEVTPDGGVGIDLFSTNLRQTWAHLIGAFGGTMFTSDGQIAFNDGTGVAALQYILDLVADGSASYDVQAAEGQPRPWQQGKAAFDLLNSSSWPTFVEQTPDQVTEEAMGMMLLPSADGGDPVMFQGGTLLTVSSRSQDQEVVQDLLEFLLEPENLLSAVEVSGKVPARSDLDDPIVTDNRMAEFIIDNFSYATAFEGGSPAWMEIRGAVIPELEAAVVGQKTAQQAVDALEAAAQDAISRL